MAWRKWLRIFQIFSTVVLVGWLLGTINWADFSPLFVSLNWGFIALSIACVLGSHLFNIVRWRCLLKPATISYSRLLHYYGAGLFANNFLPTGIGGDAIRIALLSRDVPLSQSVFSVGLDRILGLCGLAALILPALWLGLPPGFQAADKLAQVFANWQNLIIISLVVGAIVIVLGVSAWRWMLSGRPSISRFVKRFRGLGGISCWTFRYASSVLIGAYGLSAGSQLMLVAAHWAILHALNIELMPGAAIWLVLIVSLSMFVPITVNGLGIQEGLYVILLGHYGVPTTTALGVAVLIRLLMLFYSLLGGILLLDLNILSEQKPFGVRVPHDAQQEA